MTFEIIGTAHLGQARCICSTHPEGCPLHQRVDTPVSVDPQYLEGLQHELDALRAGRCPHTSEHLVLDHPTSDTPPGRLSCSMCDCFGFPPPKSFADQKVKPQVDSRHSGGETGRRS